MASSSTSAPDYCSYEDEPHCSHCIVLAPTPTPPPMSNDEEVFELPTDGVIGLLPPHESLVDLASYGPILVAQEECERNYEGDVLIVEDEEIQDTCCEVIGVSANLVFPCSNSFRFLNIQLKNLDKYTAIEVEVIDTERMRRKLQFTNSQSKTRITKQYVSMPLKLTKGWNHLSLDLDALLKAAFGTGLRKSLCKYRVVPLESVALVSCRRKRQNPCCCCTLAHLLLF